MRGIAISTDFAFAVMIFLFAIAAIYAFSNSTFHSPVREAQDIAITFDSLGILWEDEDTIRSYLNYVDNNANLVLKCYNFESGELTKSIAIYNSNPDKVYWYRMLRYHEGDLCIIDVGVVK